MNKNKNKLYDIFKEVVVRKREERKKQLLLEKEQQKIEKELKEAKESK